MRPVIPLAIVIAVSLIPVTQAQGDTTDVSLFMTAGEHPDGGEVLSFAPGTEGATHLFSPLLGGLVDQVGPTTYSWTTTTAISVDVTVIGNAVATLYFDNGLEVAGTTTVTLRSVENGTAIPIAEATHDGTAEATAHEEPFDLPTDGAILRAGSSLRLDVSIGGLEPDLLVQLQYGDAATPSGIEGLTLQVRDRDGDGFGDTLEGQAGTDPDDPRDYPGAPPLDDQDDDGLKDSWEDEHLGTRNQTANEDPDGDGCDNGCEQTAGTDPLNPDSDGDGDQDGAELDAGTNPLLAEAADPAPVQSEANPEPVFAILFFASSILVAGFALLGRFP